MKYINYIKTTRLVCALVLGLISSFNYAQNTADNFPHKPVTLVVPWAAGGGTDNITRKYALRLQSIWNQNIVVENLPGAGSVVGAQKVARAAPDGHTLMVTTNGTMTGNRFLISKLPYDPDKDFIPITLVSDIDMVILANKDFPVNNLKELVAYAKKNPGKISFGSYGKGSQPELLFGLFAKKDNIKFLHVPYKGVSQAITATMAGEVDLTLTGRGTGSAAIASGKTKIIAIMADERDPAIPNVPTTAEAGFPYLRIPTWQGVFAPAGTPKAIVDKIQRDFATVATNPEFKKEMAGLGYKVPANTPAQFSALIKEEVKMTKEMVEASGLTPD